MAKAKRKSAFIAKPELKTGEILEFAEAGKKKAASKSGQVPSGDIRLTVNMRRDLHLKLKIKAAEERTTIGELVERWVEGWR